jgi:hypothetical protein
VRLTVVLDVKGGGKALRNGTPRAEALRQAVWDAIDEELDGMYIPFADADEEEGPFTCEVESVDYAPAKRR